MKIERLIKKLEKKRGEEEKGMEKEGERVRKEELGR